MMSLWEILGLWTAISLPASGAIGALLHKKMVKPLPPTIIRIPVPVIQKAEDAEPEEPQTPIAPLDPEVGPYIYEYLREVDGAFVSINEWIPVGLDPHQACIRRGQKEGVSYAARRVPQS